MYVEKESLRLSTIFFYTPLQKNHFRNSILFSSNFQTLSAADLRDPETSAIIAAKLREFHNLDMPGSRNVVLWDRMR